MKRYIQR